MGVVIFISNLLQLIIILLTHQLNLIFMVYFQLNNSIVHFFELIFYLFRRRLSFCLFLFYVTLDGLEWLSSHATKVFLHQLVGISCVMFILFLSEFLPHYLNRHLRWTLSTKVIRSVLKGALFMGDNIELLRHFSVWALNRGDPIKILLTLNLTLACCIHILFSCNVE